MKKTWKGYAAAALAASLTMGLIGPSYGASLTLAGFGADQEIEETKPETEAKAKETAETVKPETEAKAEASKAEETAAETAKTDAPADTANVKGEETAEASKAEAKAEKNAKKAKKAKKEKKAKKAKKAQTEAQTKTPVDRSMVDTTGFAKTDDYVNVRVSGDTEGEVVGTLRANDSVYIEDVDENGWYKIRSGNVEGYVAGYLIATGEEAQAAAQESAYTYALVGAETLNVRADASGDSEVVDMVGQDADLEVVEDLGDWVKVVTENGVYGYVSSDYVSTQTVYPTGETVQEQSEREEKEYLDYVAQQEAEYEAYLEQQAQQESGTDPAAEASYNDTYEDTSYTDTTGEAAYTDPAGEASYTEAESGESTAEDTYTEESYTEEAYTEDTSSADTAAASSGDVDSLYQAYLTAQEAAMHATDEADATAKANAAIEAYNAYLGACGSAETVAPVETSAQDNAAADTTYTAETTEDTTYTDESAEDTAYTDMTYTDETAEDMTQEETPAASSGSGVGAQVASYASQFVGNPYVYGGSSLTDGADCSGFTMAVYANFGISLPHNAAAQSGCGTPVSLSDLQPGDLLFYDNGGGIGHVALYIGGGSVVHASSPETGIKISSYNYRSPVAAVRLV